MAHTTSDKHAAHKITPAAKPAKKSAPSPIGENIKLTLTAPWETVKKAYDSVLTTYVQAAELDGFRKGKAPRALVETRVGKTKLFEATIDAILPKLYADEVTQKALKPIAAPHIHPISLEEGKDWVFEVETAEAPQVSLDDYVETVKAVKAKNSLWTPGKDPKAPQPTEEEKLKTIFSALLEKIHVTIPEILVREDVNTTLSGLVRQLEKMHIPVEDYLKSVNKTADQLRQEYAMSSLTTLQLEFIIAAIARAEKITAEEKEVDAVIASLPDDAIRTANDTPHQRENIRANLIKRKTVERLLAL